MSSLSQKYNSKTNRIAKDTQSVFTHGSHLKVMKSTENVSIYGKNSIAFRLKYDNGLMANAETNKDSPARVDRNNVTMQKVKS